MLREKKARNTAAQHPWQNIATLKAKKAHCESKGNNVNISMRLMLSNVSPMLRPTPTERIFISISNFHHSTFKAARSRELFSFLS